MYLFNEFKFIIEELDFSSRNVKIYDNNDIKVLEFNDENLVIILLKMLKISLLKLSIF